MSADDSARGDRRPVGEALVAALGFEPTTTLAGTGPDRASDAGPNAAHQESVTIQTVWVDDPSGITSGDGFSGRDAGESLVSNGGPKPPAGKGSSSTDGLRPGGRRAPRDEQANGSANPGSGGQRPDPAATVDSATARATDAPAEAAPPGASKDDGRQDGARAANNNTAKSQRSKPTTVRTRNSSRSGGGGAPGGRTSAKTGPNDRQTDNGSTEVRTTAGKKPRGGIDNSPSRSPEADGEATLVASPALRPDGPPASPPGPDGEVTAPHHILPDEGKTMRVSAPAPAPPTAPAAPPQGPAGYQASTPPAPTMSRAGSTAAGATAFAGDLAARVPQLMEQGLRRSSKVRARKVRRVVRHIDPWSMLTFSVLFHLCVFASLLLASVLVWNAAEAAGTIENMESLIRDLGDYTTYEINGDVVFRSAMIIAGVLTLASSVMAVLLTVVFNLISDLVGGIRVTVVEEETVKVNRHRNQNQ